MKHWSIGKKLFTGVGVLLVLLAASSGVALNSVSTVQGNLEQAAGPISTRLSLAAGMVAAAHEAWAAERNAIVSTFTRDRRQMEASRDAGLAAFQKFTELTTELRPMLVSAANRETLDRTREAVEGWRRNVGEVAKLLEEGEPERAQELSLRVSKPAYDSVFGASEKVRLLNLNLMTERLEEGAAQYRSARWTMLATMLASLGVGAIVVWVVRSIARSLRSTLSELGESGEQVASASGQVAGTSQSLSRGSSEQAASLEEISASMEEMTAMAKRNSENSESAMGMMTETARQVERSNRALSEMTESMNGIKSSSEKVGKIIKTIDEIAFQTNILALNAAVEAARAGEAGMGFAVVADEVRNLAQRSAVAAKDTAGLIEEAIENSNQGAQRLDQVAEAIRAITASSSKVTHLVEEVSESSKQQTVGINQTSTAVAQVSKVTQTSAASAEESASAAEELSAQSRSMRELVDGLRVLVDGGEAKPALALVEPFVPVKRPGLDIKRAVPELKPGAARPFKTPSRTTTEDPFPMDVVETGNFRSF